jgi:hypothetical protein
VFIPAAVIASSHITYRAILNGLSDPDLPLKQRRQRLEFTAATTKAARWIRERKEKKRDFPSGDWIKRDFPSRDWIKKRKEISHPGIE